MTIYPEIRPLAGAFPSEKPAPKAFYGAPTHSILHGTS